jgi:hypothetical protein
MDEQVSNKKTLNYSAICEMSNTEGFKEIEKMLEWDVKFSQGLLERPKRPDSTKENPCPEPIWITNEHDIGRARGILLTAQKYLNLIKTARLKNQQN